MPDTKHGGTKHIWIDGPDGPKCNCPICGISKSEDYRRDDTCEKFILRQAERITYEEDLRPDLPIFDADATLWERFLEEQDLRSDEAVDLSSQASLIATKLREDDEDFVGRAVMAGYSLLARLGKSFRK